MRVLVVILTLIAAVTTTLVSIRPHLDRMESRLTTSVAHALAPDSRFGNVEIKFDHLNARLSGTAPDEAAKAEVERIVRATRFVGNVESRIQILKRDQPSRLVINYNQGNIHLGGTLPSEQVRNALVQAAGNVGHLSSDLYVSDRVQHANWHSEMVSDLPDLFANAKQLRLEISHAGLRMEGGVIGEPAKAALLERIQHFLPSGTNLSDQVAVLPDPTAKLMITFADGKTSVSGKLPDDAMKQRIVALLEKPGNDLDATALTADPHIESPDWAEPLSEFLPLLAKSGISSMILDGSEMTLRGEILGEAAKENLLVQAGKLSASIQDEVTLAPDQPAKISAILANGTLVIDGKLPTSVKEWSSVAHQPKTKIRTQISRSPRVILPKWDTNLAAFIEAFFRDTTAGEFHIDDQQVTVKREVKGEPAQAAMNQLVAARFPGLSINNQISLAPDRPAVLLAGLDRGKLSFSGRIANETMKRDLEKLATRSEFSEVETKELVISPRIIEPTWSKGLVEFLENAFSGTDSGEIEFGPDGLRLKRSVKGESGKSALLAAAKTFWPEADVSSDLTIEPDQPVIVNIAMADKSWTISGQISDDVEKKRLTAILSELAPMFPIQDEFQVSPLVIPPNWGDDMTALISAFFTGTTTGTLKLDGKSLALNRDGLTSEAKANLGMQASRLLPRGGKLIDEMKLAPDQPAVLLATLKEKTLELTGTLPNVVLKSQIEKAAAKTGFEVSSRLQLSDEVAVPKWEKGISDFLVAFLADAESAELELNAKGLRLKREVATNELRGSLLARANLLLPDGAGLSNQLTLPPDKPASLSVQLAEGKLRLKGWIPDDATKARLGDLASPLQLEEGAVENSLRTSTRIIPPAWLEGVKPLFLELFSETDAAELEISPEGVRLKRVTSSPDHKKALLAKAEALLPKDGTLTDQITVVIPKVATLRVTLAGKKLLIEGMVPNADIKAAIDSQLASIGKFEVTNELTVEEELALPGWESQAAAFARGFFAETEAAELELTPEILRLQRQVASADAKAAFLKQAKVFLPQDGKMIDEITVVLPSPPTKGDPAMEMKPSATETPESASMSPPIVASPIVLPMTVESDQPLVASLVATISENQIQLSGTLPDSWSRDAILKGARKAGNVVDQIIILDDVPNVEWPPTIGDFLPLFAEKALNGRLVVEANEIALFGETKDTADKEILLATIRSTLPKAFELKDRITTQMQVKKEILRTIFFKPGSTWIDPESAELIAEAGRSVLNEPNLRILIKGYADSKGDPETNAIVSQLRAKEVRKLLIQQGIDPDNLEQVGAGEGNGSDGGQKVDLIVIKSS